MTDKQENKLSMDRATELVLDNNSAKWSTDVLFANVKAALSDKIAALLTARQRQQEIITGITIDKKTLKNLMVAKSESVAAKVMIYAEDTNNNELHEAVKLSHSALDRARDEVVGGICQNIHGHANDNIAALAPYGITAATLTDLQTAINVYQLKVPQPRAAKAAKSAVTKQISTLIADIDKILKNRLDKLMEDYKVSESEFYNAYKSARVIVDLGATHTKLRMQVNDMNGAAIQEATASLLQNNIILYTAKSDADGKILFPKVKPGIYALKTEKAKFATRVETGVKFQAGKQIKRTVVLFPGTPNPGGGTLVREGDLVMGTIFNVDLTGLKPTVSTNVTIEATNSTFRVYVSTTNNGLPDTVFVDVASGTVFSKLIFDFAQQIGYDSTHKYLMVQNIGTQDGHYKFTFDNLEV